MGRGIANGLGKLFSEEGCDTVIRGLLRGLCTKPMPKWCGPSK